MPRKNNNIYAHTEMTPNYPGFVSLNTSEGKVELIVRESVHKDGTCGNTVTLTLPLEELPRLAKNLREYLQ